jgi:hypothetical protein
LNSYNTFSAKCLEEDPKVELRIEDCHSILEGVAEEIEVQAEEIEVQAEEIEVQAEETGAQAGAEDFQRRSAFIGTESNI